VRGRAAGRGLGSSGLGDESSGGGPRLAADPIAPGSSYVDGGVTDSEGWVDDTRYKLRGTPVGRQVSTTGIDVR